MKQYSNLVVTKFDDDPLKNIQVVVDTLPYNKSRFFSYFVNEVVHTVDSAYRN